MNYTNKYLLHLNKGTFLDGCGDHWEQNVLEFDTLAEAIDAGLKARASNANEEETLMTIYEYTKVYNFNIAESTFILVILLKRCGCLVF